MTYVILGNAAPFIYTFNIDLYTPKYYFRNFTFLLFS
nr:MAG TPA: hypothetical protein [Caudoviricetes sp.]